MDRSFESSRNLRSNRIHLMDEIRGFCVFCMLFYHAFYLAAFLFQMKWAYHLFEFFMPVEPMFAGTFIFIAGISSQLARSNLYRGLKLAVVAILVTVCTALVVPEQAIWFGILHLLSFCMIFYGLTKHAIDQIPAAALLTACVGIFLLTYGFLKAEPYFGLPFVPALQIPVTVSVSWLFPIGLRTVEFFSSDYFPILPWLAVYLAGTVLGRVAAAGRFPTFTLRKRVPFFSWLGRHALILYVVHQPLFYGIFWLIGLCL